MFGFAIISGTLIVKEVYCSGLLWYVNRYITISIRIYSYVKLIGEENASPNEEYESKLI